MRKIVAIAACVLFVGLVGLADYLTGYEIALRPFYLLPVIAATIYAGPFGGLGIAVLGGVTWCVCDRLAGHTYSHAWALFWNAGMRLLTAMIVVALTALLCRVLGFGSSGDED